MTTESPAVMRRSILAGIFMIAASAGSRGLVPTKKLSDLRPPFDLKTAIPKNFGDWREEIISAGVVNPQTQELLDKVYSQILSRTYRNSTGERIMLSLAYGADQTSNSSQMHFPEVCYPAQGFQVLEIKADTLAIDGKAIPIKRLKTKMGRSRTEPVTYWALLGEHLTDDSWSRRVAEMRHGFKGEIADGMLVRISNISEDFEKSFELHARFAKDMVTALPPASRSILLGAGW